MCQPLLDKAQAGEDAGTAEFLVEWLKMADKLADLASEDEARGRLFSAGEKLKRAAIYYTTAERMQGVGHSGRETTYTKAVDAFRRGTEYADDTVETVEIPFGAARLSAYYVRAPDLGPRPVVVYCNGLDSTKELLWFSGLPAALRKRGISTFCVDQPGTGEALRKYGLPATHEGEHWASPWVDWLEQQADVDRNRIAMCGISLGGYFSPRAVALRAAVRCGRSVGCQS